MASGGPVLFCALPLGEALGPTLSERVRPTLAVGSWRFPRPEGLHLTLFYLGRTTREDGETWAAELGDALSGLLTPRLVLDRTGRFPERGRARVLWVGASEAGVEGRLAALRDATLEATRRTGLGREALAVETGRPFRPHVTVARPRDPRGARELPAAFLDLAPGLPWEPREAVLLESVRGEGPARYVPRARFPLGEGQETGSGT